MASTARKILRYSLIGLSVIVVVIVLLIGAAFLYMWHDVSRIVVATARSPNGHVEATLTETNGGATTDFGYLVKVRVWRTDEDETEVANLYGAGRNEHAYGVNLVWLNDHVLELQYLNADAAKVEKSVLTVGGQTITVRLKSGVMDPNAPGGAMQCQLPGNPCSYDLR